MELFLANYFRNCWAFKLQQAYWRCMQTVELWTCIEVW